MGVMGPGTSARAPTKVAEDLDSAQTHRSGTPSSLSEPSCSSWVALRGAGDSKHSGQRSIPWASFVHPASLRKSRTFSAMDRGGSPTFAGTLSSDWQSGPLHETLKKGPSTIPILLLYPRSRARTPTVTTQKTDALLHSGRHLSLMHYAAQGPTPGQDWPRKPAPPLVSTCRQILRRRASKKE
jgi:hypothetical protein